MKQQLQLDNGGGMCERNISADTKVSAEWGAPSVRAEIPPSSHMKSSKMRESTDPVQARAGLLKNQDKREVI